jgi:hypothetical protein
MFFCHGSHAEVYIAAVRMETILAGSVSAA